MIKRFTGTRRAPVVLVGGSSSLVMCRRMIEYARANVSAGKEKPHVVCLPTASGDNPEITAEVSGYLDRLPCTYDMILAATAPAEPDETARRMEAADVVYVPGGSEQRIIDVWAKCGADEALFRIARRGSALIVGSSAGAMAWAHACPFVTEEGQIKVFAGYGLVPVWYTPHYQMEEYKGFDAALAAQSDPPLGFASGDDAGILCTPDGRYFTFFGSEGNSVWRFTRTGGGWTRDEFPEGADVPL